MRVRNALLLLSVAAFVLAVFFAQNLDTNRIVATEQLASVSPAVLLAHTNADRVVHGVSILVENPLLSKAAQAKADDMMSRGYYAHETPEGHSPLYFVDAVGYTYLNLGENLDLTYEDTEIDVQRAWMNSPTHRANLLLPVFTEVGVGVKRGMYKGALVTFVVQLYATPLPKVEVEKKQTKIEPVLSVSKKTPPPIDTADTLTAPVRLIIADVLANVPEVVVEEIRTEDVEAPPAFSTFGDSKIFASASIEDHEEVIVPTQYDIYFSVYNALVQRMLDSALFITLKVLSVGSWMVHSLTF